MESIKMTLISSSTCLLQQCSHYIAFYTVITFCCLFINDHIVDSFTIIQPQQLTSHYFQNYFTKHSIQLSSSRQRQSLRLASSKRNKLTNWVVENLESDDTAANNTNTIKTSITSVSGTKAGENDILPEDGLLIERFCILPAGNENSSKELLDKNGDAALTIKLLLGRNGWGTGVHPTTRLCLEWLCSADVIIGGEKVIDYGCGSGVLSIAALSLGAASTIGVDVEAEALVSSTRNLELNDFGDRFEGLHTREVIPYNLFPPSGADVCVANILIGQLVRPSMVSAIVSNLAPGAWLCLSGIRPKEVDSLKAAYGDFIVWEESHYGELAAENTEGSLESFGFDVGVWSRVIGRRKVDSGMDIESMSELAVS